MQLQQISKAEGRGGGEHVCVCVFVCKEALFSSGIGTSKKKTCNEKECVTGTEVRKIDKKLGTQQRVFFPSSGFPNLLEKAAQ